MSDKQVAYIAGMGMVTSVGANVEMTAAAVRAGISGYATTDSYSKVGDQVIMSLLPQAFFDTTDVQLDANEFCSDKHERMLKMAVVSIKEALNGIKHNKIIPLILAFSETNKEILQSDSSFLISGLLNQKSLPLKKEKIHAICTGRSAGIEALNLAYRYLQETNEDYVLLGGSDSYFECTRLTDLDEDERLLSAGNFDGFSPGEAAGFILVTKNINNAKGYDNSIVVMHTPVTSSEPGFIGSDKPYLGEGLAAAISGALSDKTEPRVTKIYSTLNGERYWAKEIGVAITRNYQFFSEDLVVEHPAESLGDIGASIAPVLIGLAARNIFEEQTDDRVLIYCSSDGPGRGALCMEKINLNGNNFGGPL